MGTSLSSPQGVITKTEEDDGQVFSIKFHQDFARQRNRVRTMYLHVKFDNSEMRPKLQSVTYGTWACSDLAPPTTEPPTDVLEGEACAKYVVVNPRNWQDGQEGKLELPVSRTLDTWFVEVGFSAPTTTRSIVEADLESSKCGLTYRWRNLPHNKVLQAGSKLSLQYNFYFNPEDEVEISSIRFGNSDNYEQCGVDPSPCPT